MSTYLLAWNPNRWQWHELEDTVLRVAAGHEVVDRWSVGNTRSIAVGDRVFLIRLAEDPRGVFASGWVTEAPFEGPHWEDDRAELGDTALYVMFEYDVLLNPEIDDIIHRDVLLHDPRFSDMHWQTQVSGIRIPDDIAESLEEEWAKLNGRSALFLPEEIARATTYSEGVRQQIFVNRYERNPLARQRCIDHYGSRCIVCGFDFEAVYGEVGRGFIHVHHLVPLSSIDENTKSIPFRICARFAPIAMPSSIDATPHSALMRWWLFLVRNPLVISTDTKANGKTLARQHHQGNRV